MKCGSCQQKTIANSAAPLRSTLPRDAVQPISAGSAPGTAPMTVDSGVRRFIGV